MKFTSKSCYYFAFLVALCLSFSHCFPPVEEDYNLTKYSLSDPVVQKIIEFQDRRQSDSLMVYANNEKAKYRLLAFKAFASFKDSQIVTKIALGLKDQVEEIRQAAAFALGQQAHFSAEKYLTEAFIAVDSGGAFQITNGMILEALGKCGTDTSFRFLCETELYEPKDTAMIRGLLFAYYQFGLREKICKNIADKLVGLINNTRYDDQTRLLAAHCLQRFKSIDISSHYETLKQLCINEKNPFIRMCIISAFARSKNAGTVSHLEEIYSRGLDIRVQSNLIRSLQYHSGPAAIKLAIRASQNPSLHVSIPAAQYLIDKGGAEFADNARDLLDLNLPWQIRSMLFEAALIHTPQVKKLTWESILYRLQNHIQQAKNPYEKSAYIKAMGHQTKYLGYILNLYKNDLPAIVKTSLAETIEKIISRPDFNAIYKTGKNPIYGRLTEFYNQQILAADAGTLSVMASTFQKTNAILNAYFNPDSALIVAREKLSLPRDIETYNELGACLAKLKKENYQKRQPDYNHPIDWNEVSKISDSVYVKINTDKGLMRLLLLTKEAPATVLNFVQLVRQSFYSDKIFHRVVPNFVVQSGCPRGDGYGSLDYSIRTEIGNLRYLKEGCVGMASAGPDTECSQFFITHSPTPHLDGKYTLFGKLIEGFDVLMSIQPGDKINNVIIE